MVESTLKGMGFQYENEGRFFRVIIENEDADYHFKIFGAEKQELLLIVGYFPIKVSKSNLDRMYKVVNDLNYKTTVGSFVIDSDDGELTFRVANNVDGGVINEKIVKVCLHHVAKTLMSSYEKIMSAMFGVPQMLFSFNGGKEPDEQ